MKIFTGLRVVKNEFGIFGLLIDEKNIIYCYTLENDKYEIDQGEFMCKRSFYHKGGYETFEIIVPNRDRLLFHKGVIDDHSLGCVLLGEQTDPVFDKEGKPLGHGILASGQAFKQFLDALKGDNEFKYIIKEVWK